MKPYSILSLSLILLEELQNLSNHANQDSKIITSIHLWIVYPLNYLRNLDSLYSTASQLYQN